MSFIQQQLNTVIARLNAIASSAKNIFQLPLTSGGGTKWIAVYNQTSGETERINLADITSQAGLPDGLVASGTATINEIDDTITFSVGWIVRISLNLASNFTPVTIAVPLATDQRFDIFVMDVTGSIIRVAGVDSETPVVPSVPSGTILLTTILVTDTEIGTPVTPDLVGFVQKVYFDYSEISLDIETLPADGRSNFVIESPLAVFKGFNGNSELFRGKRFIIRNESGDDCALTSVVEIGVTLPFFETIVLEDGKSIEFDLFDNALRKIGEVGGGGGGGTWGSITGTLSDQIDLQTALDEKLEIVNTEDIVNGAVTNAKFRNSTAHTVVGRAGSGNGSVADIGLSNDRILGREGSGNVEGLSVSQVQSMLEFHTKQDKTEIKSTDFTAEFDKAYNIIDTATITNPTGVEGKSYSFNVVKGITTLDSNEYFPKAKVTAIYIDSDWSYQVSITESSDTVERVNAVSAMTKGEFELLAETIPNTIYIIEETDPTGWQSLRTETAQSINGEALFLIDDGTSVGNGGLTLIDSSNGTLLGLQENDRVAAKLKTTVVTPATSGEWFKVVLKVNDVIVEGSAIYELKQATGVEELFSVLFNVDVTADMVTYGAKFYVQTSANITFNDRSVASIRTHKSTTADD